jgi:hypothetical protein
VLERLAGGQDEAKLPIEDEHPGPGQLAESSPGGIVGTRCRPIWVGPRLYRHIQLSAGAADHLTAESKKSDMRADDAVVG